MMIGSSSMSAHGIGVAASVASGCGLRRYLLVSVVRYTLTGEKLILLLPDKAAALARGVSHVVEVGDSPLRL